VLLPLTKRLLLQTRAEVDSEGSVRFIFSEHVGVVSAICWGLEALKSKNWTGKVLHMARHDGPLAVLKEIAAARTLLRLPAKHKALSNLEQYVAKRVEMMDYPAASLGSDVVWRKRLS
jgi:hypothetical protein